MTSTFLRAACLLAMALGLGACGGKAEFQVTGVVSGLRYPTLKLSTNGQSVTVLPADTNGTSVEFKFPNTISYGDEYSLVIDDPQPAHQTCSFYDPVNNAKGVAGRLAAIRVVILCGVQTHTVGGTVSDLTSTGLTIINGSTGGSALVAPVPADPVSTTVPFKPAPYMLPVAVPYFEYYGLSILNQPLYDNCTITGKAAGQILDANISDVSVACTRDAIAGSVTGLTAVGLTLKNAIGGATTVVAKDATVFSFGKDDINKNVTYDLQVATQPAGLICTVTNGTGTVSSTALPISVACKAG
jgi:hypothetical protein